MPKRIPAFILTFVLLILMVFPPLAASPSPTTLTVWGWLDATESLRLNLEAFGKAHPELKVSLKTMAPDAIYRKLPAVLPTGIGAPDIVILEDSHLAELSSTGGLLELKSLYAAYGKSYNSFKWANCLWQGRPYAMPWDSAPVALYYRRDLFAQAGLASDPEAVARLLGTWTDYHRVARTIKEQTGAYMFAMPATGNDGRLFEILLQQRGAGYFNASGRVTLDGTPAVPILEFLGLMYKDGLTQDAAAWTDTWQSGIREGKVATIIGASWFNNFLQNWIATGTSGQWGVVPLPAWTKENGARTSNDGGSSLAIAKRSRNPRSAQAFLEFMLTRKESQLNMMMKRQAFPALEEVYQDPYFDAPDPFYLGQAVNRVFATLAPQIPDWYYTSDYGLANSLCSAQIQAYLMGTIDAAGALAKAAKDLRAKTHRP